MNSSAAAADAMVGELNDGARSWAGQFTAVRRWQPVWQLEDLVEARVTVIPDSVPSIERTNRGRLFAEEHLLFLLLQVKLDGVTDEAIDGRADLLETLKDWFLFDQHPLATMENGRCTGARIETYCWRPHLEEFGAYTGVAALTIRIDRSLA